jgi:hypothetical protein
MKGRLMNGRTTKLGGVFAATLLALGALSATGCPGDDDNDADGGTSGGGIPGLGNLAKQCGLTCPEAGKGVLYGTSSISGYAPIDGFFRSVVNYNTVATGVSAEIDAELNGIQSLFGVADTEITAAGSLGAAITAKLAGPTLKASVVVNAQPARCSVDAHIAAEVTAKCQAQANCAVDPGKATFQCMGTCNVDVDVNGMCSANAVAHCKVTGPSVACQGQCSGSCSVMAPSVSCSGNCRGTCSGTCSASGDANGDGTTAAGECVGSCSGMCTGSCEVSGMAALSCMGTCNGSCEYQKPSGSCEANAEVSCDLNASASASCTGRCDGSFEPPSVMCDASASCQASAKAEARFQVVCTPPSVEVKVVAQAGGAAQVQVDFLIAQLKLRLPRLSAATAHAKLASQAGGELGVQGKAAVQGTITAVANGKVDFITGVKIGQCVPPQLTESDTVIAQATATLKKSTDNAASVANTFGMVM